MSTRRHCRQRSSPFALAVALACLSSACALATSPEVDSGRPRRDGTDGDATGPGDTSTPRDAAPTTCTIDGDCRAPTPFCDATSHACVACRTSTDCAAPSPFCDPTSHACTTSCSGPADCDAAACLACTSGVCTTTCTTGRTCDGRGTCACPSGTRACGGSCIGAASCCSTADCPSGSTCPSPGGTCSCPSGQRACASLCISSTQCCTVADCSSGMTCSGAGGTCGCAPGTCAGACSGSCGAGQTCRSGICVACGHVGEICCTGAVCSSGVCTGALCRACGAAGQPCCAGSSCTSGVCAGVTCASFGGAYETNVSSCAACYATNPLATACACPPGAVPLATLDGINDCAGGSPTTAGLVFCATATYTAGSDFAGVYQVDDAVACGRGCRVPNAYTGGCSCPSGATAVSMRSLARDTCGGIIGSVITACVPTTATRVTFGGVYQGDDSVPGGIACRAANPRTGGCSCPSGTSPHGLRVEVDTPSAIGSHIFVCMP